MFRKTLLAAPLALGLLASPAFAQQTGLVNIALGSIVVQDIANDLNVNVSQVPVTVQVPVGVAANVCPNVNANVLAEQRGTAAPVCTATNNSTALTEIVQRQLNQQ